MRPKANLRTMIAALLMTAMLALILLVQPGCANPNQLAVDQAQDYHATVVEGVLLPFYLDPDPTPRTESQKANVQAAIEEHGEFLDEWLAGIPR